MKLYELRENWERGLEEVGISVHNEPSGYKTIYVFLIKPLQPKPDYYLHRYFTVGDEWSVSVDCKHETLDNCVKWMSQDMTSLYPLE